MPTKPDSYVAPPELIRAAFDGCTQDEVAFVARQCLELGAWDHALALCDALGHADAPAVTLCRAVAAFVSGDGDGALSLVDAVLARHPSNLSALAVKAQMLARSGDRAAAASCLVELTSRYPDYPGAHAQLASLLMPGPHYRDVLRLMHERLKPRSYLEIGVESGATLALAAASTIAVGVDPAQTPMAHPLGAGTRVVREESDAFFAARRREDVYGARRVDLAFIDGLHVFEQALRDFRHAEAWAHADATIVLHDCVPIVAHTATPVRGTKFWVGDTWKVVLALAHGRPDLKIRTLLTAPSGLVVVRRLNPGSSVLFDRYDELVARFRDASWTWQTGTYPPELGCVTNDERGLSSALA